MVFGVGASEVWEEAFRRKHERSKTTRASAGSLMAGHKFIESVLQCSWVLQTWLCFIPKHFLHWEARKLLRVRTRPGWKVQGCWIQDDHFSDDMSLTVGGALVFAHPVYMEPALVHDGGIELHYTVVRTDSRLS